MFKGAELVCSMLHITPSQFLLGKKEPSSTFISKKSILGISEVGM